MNFYSTDIAWLKVIEHFEKNPNLLNEVSKKWVGPFRDFTGRLSKKDEQSFSITMEAGAVYMLNRTSIIDNLIYYGGPDDVVWGSRGIGVSVWCPVVYRIWRDTHKLNFKTCYEHKWNVGINFNLLWTVIEEGVKYKMPELLPHAYNDIDAETELSHWIADEYLLRQGID